MIAKFFNRAFELLVAWGDTIHSYRMSRASRTWYY
jgi:hypothetical protein